MIHALHIRLDHPSKHQLQKLVLRHFYSPGLTRIIDEVCDSCVTCTSLKNLPKELFSESTSENRTFGASFSADVIKKDGQLIFVCREKLSQFTFSRIITDETADSLRDSLVTAVIEFIPESGTTIQVDCATGFQKIASESKMDGSILQKLGIKVELGRTHNINKNPVAENCIKEFLKERLRLSPNGGPVSELERAQITKNMNGRVRERGVTAKEIAYNRDQISNEVKKIPDPELSDLQLRLREGRHHKVAAKTDIAFNIGDNVFMKRDINKLRGREAYKIVNIYISNNEEMATIRKSDKKFMAKDYEVKLAEIIPINKQKIKQYNSDEELESAVAPEREVVVPGREVVAPGRKIVAPGHEVVTPEHEVSSSNDGNNNPEDKSTDNDRIDADTENRTSSRRPKRRSAIKQENLLKKLITSKSLHVADSKPPEKKIPTHGFCYEEWVRLLDSNDEQPQKSSYKPMKDGIQNLRMILLGRNINPEACVGEVLETIHDYIDFHTIGARVEIAASKIQNWYRKVSLNRNREAAAILVQRWFRDILVKRSEQLIWDHSPQKPNSEASFIWTDELVDPGPESFIRLYSEEIIMETVEELVENIENEDLSEECSEDDDDLTSTTDEDVFHQAMPPPGIPNSKLKRNGAFRRKEQPTNLRLHLFQPNPPTTPLLHDEVDLHRSQYLLHALDDAQQEREAAVDGAEVEHAVDGVEVEHEIAADDVQVVQEVKPF